MAVLQTGQSFSSGDQVTATKLQDIANLATFRTGANQTADDSTIQVDGSGGYLKVKSAGISSNELATDSVITAKIQDGAVTAAKLDSAAVSVLMPTATILPYAGISLPGVAGDWLYCDGSEYNREISPGVSTPLFLALGTTYGVGNGSTTFNIPDLRGRVIAGLDNMGGTAASRLTGQTTLGGSTGTQSVTLTIDQIPSHSHNTWGSGIQNGGTNGSYGDLGSQTLSTTSTGGGNSHTNVQPTMTLNYIIKT